MDCEKGLTWSLFDTCLFGESRKLFGESRKLYPMERVFCIHIIKITFFVYFRNIFWKKVTNLRRTDILFFTVYPCFFSLYIYVFETKQARKEESISNRMFDNQTCFLFSLYFLLTLFLSSLSSLHVYVSLFHPHVLRSVNSALVIRSLAVLTKMTSFFGKNDKFFWQKWMTSLFGKNDKFFFDK